MNNKTIQLKPENHFEGIGTRSKLEFIIGY